MGASKNAAALSLIGALSLLSSAAQSAPLTSLSAAAKTGAQQTSTVQVRFGGWGGGWHGGGWGGGWRGGGWGWGLGALAAGALVGAAIASPYYYSGYDPYYGYPYYGDYPYYGYRAPYYPAYRYYYRPYRSYPYW